MRFRSGLLAAIVTLCVTSLASAQFIGTSGSSGGGGTPGGSDTQVQRNNSGSFGGTSGETCTATQCTTVAPILGTPQSVTLTNGSGLPLTTGVTGVLPVANGGDNCSSASITCLNNITGFSYAGTTGGTTGNLVGSVSPTLTGSPVAPTQSASDNGTKIATTAYVTTGIANALAGANPAIAVQAATTAAGDTSGLTYNNGVSGIGATFTGSVNTALTVDGFTFTALNQRLLVKNDTQSPSGAFNGVYYVTQLQTGILPPILTRALDYDAPSDINNTGAIPVINGTVNGTTQWVITSSVATVGTDPLTYAKFSSNPSTVLSTTLTSAHLFVGNGSNIATDAALSGDCTMANTGAITCTKTNGSSFGTSATVNTGTSGAAIPLLNGVNTWSGAQKVTPSTLTISTATFTPSFDASNNFTFTLVHASCPCTLANPSTTPVAGQTGVIEIIQSATGSDTITTWGSNYTYAGGTSTITLSSGANARDYLSYYVADSTHIVLSTAALNATH